MRRAVSSSRLDFCIARSFDVSGISIGPFAQFGRLSWAFGAADMPALVADVGGGRDEESVALVAGTSDTLLDRLVDALLSRLGGDGQNLLLLLGRLGEFPLLSLLHGVLLQREAGALLAAPVLALGTHLVGAKGVPTVVAAAVDAHADGTLNALDVDGLGSGGDPLVRLEGQSILGKESAGAFLLEDAAVQLVHVSDGRGRGLARRGSSRCGSSRCGSSRSGRTVVCVSQSSVR